MKRRIMKLIGYAIVLIIYGSLILTLMTKSDIANAWPVKRLVYLQMPLKISMYLIPILLLVYLLLSIKYKESNQKSKLFLLVILLSFAFISSYYNQIKQTVYASGLAEIEYKIKDVDGYVVQIGEKRLLCDEADYLLLTQKKRYRVIYEWQVTKPNDGRLRYVEALESDSY